MELSWLRSSSGMYSQNYACTLIPKTPGSASLSPSSYAFSSNFASCLYANIRNYDSILCASWWLWRASVCELAWRIRGFPLRVITLASAPPPPLSEYTHRSRGGNLISMITNTITQTWDRADLHAVARGLDLCGFGAFWACEIWKCNSGQSLSQHEWSCRSDDRAYIQSRTVELCTARIRFNL